MRNKKSTSKLKFKFYLTKQIQIFISIIIKMDVYVSVCVSVCCFTKRLLHAEPHNLVRRYLHVWNFAHQRQFWIKILREFYRFFRDLRWFFYIRKRNPVSNILPNYKVCPLITNMYSVFVQWFFNLVVIFFNVPFHQK